jgi:hypothetical protein
MGIKAFFDLIMNDRMELYLLDRKIKFYWEKKQREEQQKQKVMESMRQHSMFQPPPSPEVPMAFLEQNQ